MLCVGQKHSNILLRRINIIQIINMIKKYSKKFFSLIIQSSLNNLNINGIST